MGYTEIFFKHRAIITTIAFIVIFILIWITGKEFSRHENFDGTIDNVTYDIKHRPTVAIKGETYSLGYPNWDFYIDTIEKGDRLIKVKGSLDLKLIKLNYTDTINFLH